MIEPEQQADSGFNPLPMPVVTSRSIDWYHEGEERILEFDGYRVTIRFVGRKGRRARIAITAPAGTSFRSVE